MRKKKRKNSGSGDPTLRAAILEVVENQLRAGTPPEARETLERLLGLGISREEALKYIGCCVTCEIFDVLKNNQDYNEARYIAALRALPTLPWDKDDSE